jgi:hypothetical protein
LTLASIESRVDIAIESEVFLHLLVAAVRCYVRDLRQS